MNTPNFLESHVSQIPSDPAAATARLHLSFPEEVAVERQGKAWRSFAGEGSRHPAPTHQSRGDQGSGIPFTEEAIIQAIEKLRTVPFDGLCRTSEAIFDLLTLGVSIDQEIDGENQGTQPAVHRLGASAQQFVSTSRPSFGSSARAATRSRRPDIVCFVNGIPFIVIECKRRDEKDSLEAAIKQHLRNQEDAEIPQLYTCAPVLLALNKDAGRYGPPARPRNSGRRGRSCITPIPKCGPPSAPFHAGRSMKSCSPDEFAYARNYFERMAAAGSREVTGQDRLIFSVCRPDRLIEMVPGSSLSSTKVEPCGRLPATSSISRSGRRWSVSASGMKRAAAVAASSGTRKAPANHSRWSCWQRRSPGANGESPNPSHHPWSRTASISTSRSGKPSISAARNPSRPRPAATSSNSWRTTMCPVITTVLDKFGAAAKANETFRNLRTPTCSCSWTRATGRNTARPISGCSRRCPTPVSSASPARRS
jgi:hypothetical protein